MHGPLVSAASVFLYVLFPHAACDGGLQSVALSGGPEMQAPSQTCFLPFAYFSLYHLMLLSCFIIHPLTQQSRVLLWMILLSQSAASGAGQMTQWLRAFTKDLGSVLRIYTEAQNHL